MGTFAPDVRLADHSDRFAFGFAIHLLSAARFVAGDDFDPWAARMRATAPQRRQQARTAAFRWDKPCSSMPGRVLKPAMSCESPNPSFVLTASPRAHSV
jgi:hypothetical protein